MSIVRYEKEMRERAKREKKFLVTVSVDGKHLKDDSCRVQFLADIPRAREIAAYALGLLIKSKKSHRLSARLHTGERI